MTVAIGHAVRHTFIGKHGSDETGSDLGGDGKGGPPDNKIKAGSPPTKDIELGSMGGSGSETLCADTFRTSC